MKAKPQLKTEKGFRDCSIEEATHVQLHMPGPYPNRFIPVQLKGTRAGTGNWSWNGDTEFPTLKPSILTRGGYFDENNEQQNGVCHCWVTDGKVQFLSDTTHEFANQTINLLEVL